MPGSIKSKAYPDGIYHPISRRRARHIASGGILMIPRNHRLSIFMFILYLLTSHV